MTITENGPAREQLTPDEMLRFFSVLSHDLKSPIFSIDGFSELLIADYSGKLDEEGEDFLRRIRSSAQQMKRVLDEMNHMVKLAARPIASRDIDLQELFEELRLKYSYILDEGGVRFHTEVNVPAITTDPEFLKEALGALIKNAAHFSDREKGDRDVWVSVEKAPDGTRFCVRDNGIGIDPRYTDQIFDLGIKLDKSRGGGPGYGLFLARKVVSLLGGSMSVDAKLNEGATFCFTLP